ncbi:membrane protein [Streptomyces phage SoJo]|nr:membrane protein [Streptomyces phage SoJo]
MNAKNKRAIRTALQTLAAVAAVLPVLAALLADSDLAVAAPWIVGAAVSAAGVAGIVARVMASPAVEALLDRFGLGLVDDGGTAE